MVQGSSYHHKYRGSSSRYCLYFTTTFYSRYKIMLALKQIFSKSSKSPTNTYEWVHDPSASWCPYGFDGVANAISRSRRLDPAAYAANAANAVSEFDRNFYGTNDTDDSVTEVFGADIKSSSSCSLLASPNDNYSATTNSTQIFHPDTQALTVQASSHPAASYQREGIPGSEGICDKEPTDNFQDQPWQRTQETADSDIENIEAQVETNNTQGGWTLCPIQLKLSGDRPPVACQKKFPTERAAQ
ncbi:hypothetical protein EDC01DRAFT_320949 [Geopyxis carbonaria]|nr:hypothetical protein EDC01DRAFT_320949 [Geopyxis carbonaria]